MKDLESLLEEIEDENAELRKKIDDYEKPVITTSDTYQITTSPNPPTWNFAPVGPASLEIHDDDGWISIGGEKLTKDDIETLKEVIKKHNENE